MAAKRNTPKTQRKRDQHEDGTGVHWSDSFSYVLIGVAILIFLALISFSTADLPQWTNFNLHAEAASPTHNFIGPVGALIGLSLYLTLGAAAYIVPAGLIWLGILKLLGGSHVQNRILIGLTGILLVSAALLDIFYKQNSGLYYELIGSTGGFLGQLIGGNILQNLFSTVGAAIVLIIAYFICLIFVTGFHPFQFLSLIHNALASRRQQTRQRREEEINTPSKPDPTEPRPRSRRNLLDNNPSPSASIDAELPLTFPREVKIFDASVRAANNPSKPSSNKQSASSRKTKTSANFDHISYPDYQLPGMNLLDWDDNSDRKPADKGTLIKTQRTIIDTLATFGIEVSEGDITRGPTITRYEIYPGRGLRVGRIAALEADIARATRAERINIIAPIPGKDTVGIEIANNDKILVPLRELLEDPAFTNHKKRIPIALGKDVYGETIVGDLAAMPHLLVAGATGSGKSVCINSIIASILFRFSPDELRFIMIDPKVVEMQDYNTLPHLVVPVVTDPKKVILALRWVVNEMERRYRIFARVGARNFDSFNGRKKPETTTTTQEESNLVDEDGIDSLASALENGDITPPDTPDLFQEEPIPDRIPYIVVIIDELADLMQTAPADVETAIARIAQKARAAGIHLIVATQTPRADVVTGIIKANIPTRIAFQVSSKIDSRVILDQSGADKLVGKGDLLYLPPGGSLLLRCQGAMITDDEVHRLVKHCSSQGGTNFETTIQEAIENNDTQEDFLSEEDDDLLQKCIEVIAQEKRASTSLLQRRLRLGYTRAARMIDVLEQRGIIGPGEGAKARDILVDLSEV